MNVGQRAQFIRSIFSRRAAARMVDAAGGHAAAETASDNDYRLGDWPQHLNSELKDFLEYWLGKHGADGSLPRRGDIDPAEIPELLPGIVLIDVEHGASALRFKFRLLGTRHTFANQASFAGRYIEDVLTPDDLAEGLVSFTTIIGRKLPHYRRRGPITFRDRIHPGFERVMVPLSNDGENVSMLFGLYVFVGAQDDWHWWRRGGNGRA